MVSNIFRNEKGRIYASTIFEYAISLKIITDNPFNHIKAPRKKSNQKHETMKYYTSDELQQFLELVKIMFYIMLYFVHLPLLVSDGRINGFNME